MNEIRAVWVVDHSKSPVLRSPSDITEALDFLQAHGFNTVFPAVWNRGFTAFPSQVMVNHGFPPQDSFYAGLGFDPLREIVTQGKGRGMAIIPWFEYGFAASPDVNGGHILQNKPEWAAIDQHGDFVRHGSLTWMNALNPAVQKFMTDLMTEVIVNYEVDGVQGDDRLPALPFTGGYDAQTQDQFRAKFGVNPPSNPKDPTWIQFRCDILTEYLSRLRVQVKATKSTCALTIAPSPFSFGRDNLMQDSHNWVAQGLVDILLPQLYRTSFPNYKPEVQKIRASFPDAANRAKFAPGIAFRANNVDLSTADIIQCVQHNRNQDLAGVSFFFYEGLKKNNNEIAIALKSQADFDQLAGLPSPIVIT